MNHSSADKQPDSPMPTSRRRGRHRRRPALPVWPLAYSAACEPDQGPGRHRPSAGAFGHRGAVAVLGATALVGSLSAAPAGNIRPVALDGSSVRLMAQHDQILLSGVNLGASLDVDALVQLSADLVADVTLLPTELSAAIGASVVQALEAGLAAVGGLAGPVAVPLLDGIASVAANMAAFVDVGTGGLGSAVGNIAQLGADLAALVSSGDSAAALAALMNQVAVGVDAGLLDWAEAVNLGADVVGGVALLPASLGTAINVDVTAAVLTGLDSLVPIIGPLPGGLATAAATISGLVDTAITLPGDAIAWKAELDAVLADLVADGGVALTNGVTGDLMGAVGAEPTGLPDIGEADVDASLDAVVDHVTVGLAGVFLGDPAVRAEAESQPTEKDSSTAQLGEKPAKESPASSDLDSELGQAGVHSLEIGALQEKPKTTDIVKKNQPQQSLPDRRAKNELGLAEVDR